MYRMYIDLRYSEILLYYGEREVVSSIPGRGNIVGGVFHPTR